MKYLDLSGLRDVLTQLKSIFDTKQNNITSTGSGNVLTAPNVAGEQPGIKPITDFATAEQGAKADGLYAERVPTAFTLPFTSWAASTKYDRYPFQISLNIPGLAANDLVRAEFNPTSLLVAQESKVMSAGDTTANTATFYARVRPGSDLSGVYTINKVVV